MTGQQPAALRKCLFQKLLFKVYILINIFKKCSNTPTHGFSKRFYCETVSHISWRNNVKRNYYSKLIIGTSCATKEGKGREPHGLCKVKMFLPSHSKWLQGILKALIHH